jgi:hypothetical protein
LDTWVNGDRANGANRVVFPKIIRADNLAVAFCDDTEDLRAGVERLGELDGERGRGEIRAEVVVISYVFESLVADAPASFDILLLHQANLNTH